jgi:chemotaxis protein MotB
MTEPSMAPLAGVRSPATSRFAASGPDPTSNDDSGWLITLSDLTLLLLCFLVVWYVKHQERNAAAQPVKPAVTAAHESSASKETLPPNPEAQDWQVLKDEIADFIADARMGGDVEIEAAAEEIVISFKDSISFASGKADLNPQALPMLEKVAAVAVSRPAMYLKVNGHTDDRPISTIEFPSNWELSSARASRVARHLIERGVHPARIEVHGFAYHRPRVANENQSGRGANRRVEISLLRNRSSKPGQTPAS